MKLRPIAFVLVVLIVILLKVARAEGPKSVDRPEPLCPHVFINDGVLKLGENEKALVCGSTKGGEAWGDVPLPQAQYQLSVILQNQGYPEPRFVRDGDRLDLWKGPLLQTKSLVIEGADGLLDAAKKRKIIGYPLTPKTLDEVNTWADFSLRRQGFACPKITVNGHAWDQQIRVVVETGGRKKINGVERAGIDGLDPVSLQRFEGYHVGDVYDVIDTQITSTRLLNEGLFQSAYFSTHCHEDLVDLKMVTSQGKPRLLRFGLGASTEEFPFADLRYMNSRLDAFASNYSAVLHASPIWQSLNLSSELYVFSAWPAIFLGPNFVAEHRVESAYEIDRAAVGADIGRNWDIRKTAVTLRTGPSFTNERTLSGIGPGDASYVSWQAAINVSSHAYEAFIGDQNEGWNGSFTYRTSRQGLGSAVNVDRMAADFKYLWNIGSYSPPLLVLATRTEAIAIAANVNSDADRAQLPVDDRIFYGGDQNLRGFSRGSLNNGQLGYLTALYAGFELRLVEQVPYHIEPFLLYDVAQLGNNNFSLSPEIYSSPGLGVRWGSPFGTLRGTCAYGYLARSAPGDSLSGQVVTFVSFGEEF